MPVLFLTGFPGFIATRLLQEFVKSSDFEHIHLLVEPRMKEKAERALVRLGVSAELHEGDIRFEDLGLPVQVRERLHSEVTHVCHLAALYNLRVAWDPAYQVNVLGTQHVLHFARSVRSLERFIYFSTAYVSGWRTGIVFEDELVPGYGFKNHYEHTKFLAERLVRSVMEEMPVTVIRPGIVVGDSQTGETAKFDGPYFVMHFLHRIPGRFPLPYIGRSEAEVNLVPVDYIARATAALTTLEAATGKTYHLVDPAPLQAKEIYRLVHEKIRGTVPRGRLPFSWVQATLRFPSLSRTLGVPLEATPYFEHQVHYDAYHAIKDLRSLGIEVPRLTTYLDVLVAYYLQHAEDPEKQVF